MNEGMFNVMCQNSWPFWCGFRGITKNFPEIILTLPLLLFEATNLRGEAYMGCPKNKFLVG